MLLFPAIDIKDGKCVRLTQGDFNKVDCFYENPVDVAKMWYEAGAKFIHIVDLDGARTGKATVDTIIKEIKENYPVKIQIGGGIRTLDDIDRKINAGVDRVILGTVAVKNPEIVKQAVDKYGDKIAVGIDAKNSMVAIQGWEDVSTITAIDLCNQMKEYGVKTIIYTDISKDGMMCGPNIKATKELADKTNLNIIASGGVSCYEDLDNLQKEDMYGVIIGKALYSKAIDLKTAIEKYEKGDK